MLLRTHIKQLLALGGAVVVASTGAVDPAGAHGIDGPNSSDPPYLVRSQPGVVTKSILTVGDTPTGSDYRMAGIPDGLGAFDNGDGTFTVLMNHELRPDRGAVRDHGGKGAFVSAWRIDKETLEVLSGEDLIKDVLLWDAAAGSHAAASGAVFNRFCSADLPDPAAHFDGANGLGYSAGRIYLNGEEAGNEGRAFGHIATGPDAGTTYELPHFGKMSFENTVSRPVASPTTVTVGLDDQTGGQVYVHVGQKSATGSPMERAGLVGGSLFGIAVPTMASEDATFSMADNTKVPFGAVELGDVSASTGAQLDAASNEAGVTRWARPEDGAWSPDGSSFYFVTTAGFTEHSRLWRLTFADPTNPAAGGTVTMLLEGPKSGSEGPRMMDNMTVDEQGRVLIQEDPGNQSYLGSVWLYDPAVDAMTRVATHDPKRFGPGGSAFMTADEESSGIIPVFDILGEGWYLLDSQVHKAHPDAELVEYGQLLAMHVPDGRPLK